MKQTDVTDIFIHSKLRSESTMQFILAVTTLSDSRKFPEALFSRAQVRTYGTTSKSASSRGVFNYACPEEE